MRVYYDVLDLVHNVLTLSQTNINVRVLSEAGIPQSVESKKIHIFQQFGVDSCMLKHFDNIHLD
jgi:hypothetical protein